MHIRSILRRPTGGRAVAAGVAATLVGALTLTACGSSGASSSSSLRLGYFPNLTHASAIYGVSQGTFQQALGSVTLDASKTFNAGPAAVEALFANQIDATFIGPNPAVNAYIKSKGEAVRIVAGATSGGASLVVKPGIDTAADLKGKKLATPQLGNTQDVALRYWLKQHGLSTTTTGGGDVSIVPQDNSQTIDTFQQGQIDGAWVPEPYAARLVTEGGAHVLVDERTLWPDGRFATTVLLVRTDYLNASPQTVQNLIQGEISANKAMAADPQKAQQVVNDEVQKITGKGLKPAALAAAWKTVTFTENPIPSSVLASAQHAQDVGLLELNGMAFSDLKGLFDLTQLNAVLKASGQPEVSAS